jgi:hypothetical protein
LLEEQSTNGIFYIRSIYMLVIPVLQLATAYFVFRFPIHGARLAGLRERQAKVFKRVDEECALKRSDDQRGLTSAAPTSKAGGVAGRAGATHTPSAAAI